MLPRREQFAAMALQGILANSITLREQPKLAATAAVEAADALMEELDKNSYNRTEHLIPTPLKTYAGKA